jgi:ATP-dependent RNA helicase DDX23/PRP28
MLARRKLERQRESRRQKLLMKNNDNVDGNKSESSRRRPIVDIHLSSAKRQRTLQSKGARKKPKNDSTLNLCFSLSTEKDDSDKKPKEKKEKNQLVSAGSLHRDQVVAQSPLENVEATSHLSRLFEAQESDRKRRQQKRSERLRERRGSTQRMHWDDADDTSLNVDNEKEEKDDLDIDDDVERQRRKSASSAEDRLLDALDRREGSAVHWSQKPLRDMRARDWGLMRAEFRIGTRGGRVPLPMRTWRESALPARLVDAVERVGYRRPTPIQMQAIPVALAGRDLMGVAETGSGKTGAFVLPMIAHIVSRPDEVAQVAEYGPMALILAPTRELAQQIASEAAKFARPLGLRVTCIVGGVSIDEQAFELSQGSHIVVATPGRLIDCIERRYIVFSQCDYVVMDEADLMIDMGFEDQVAAILEALPSAATYDDDNDDGNAKPKRTTIMYSATMPPKLAQMAQRYLREPVRVVIGEIGKTVDRIRQQLVWYDSADAKPSALVKLLRRGPPPPIMVFVNTKLAANEIVQVVRAKSRLRAVALHSGRSQEQRQEAIDGFRAHRYQVLVATDVAGRGIDVPGVTHVIQYDLAPSVENYTHRIGRTGRAGADGLATAIVTEDDADLIGPLLAVLQRSTAKIRIPPPMKKFAH